MSRKGIRCPVKERFRRLARAVCFPGATLLPQSMGPCARVNLRQRVSFARHSGESWKPAPRKPRRVVAKRAVATLLHRRHRTPRRSGAPAAIWPKAERLRLSPERRKKHPNFSSGGLPSRRSKKREPEQHSNHHVAGRALPLCTLQFSVICNRVESIMETKLSDKESVTLYLVDESVFVGDAPGPVTRQGVLERLWFANSIER